MQLLVYASARLDKSEHIRNEQAAELAQLRSDKLTGDRILDAVKSEISSLTELLLYSRTQLDNSKEVIKRQETEISSLIDMLMHSRGVIDHGEYQRKKTLEDLTRETS